MCSIESVGDGSLFIFVLRKGYPDVEDLTLCDFGLASSRLPTIRDVTNSVVGPELRRLKLHLYELRANPGY